MIEPSPEKQMTFFSGFANAAPIAAGSPKPIVPSEPDVGVQKSTIQPPHPLFGDINIKYIDGVVESNNRLYVLLDVTRIFSSGRPAFSARLGICEMKVRGFTLPLKFLFFSSDDGSPHVFDQVSFFVC